MLNFSLFIFAGYFIKILVNMIFSKPARVYKYAEKSQKPNTAVMPAVKSAKIIKFPQKRCYSQAKDRRCA